MIKCFDVICWSFGVYILTAFIASSELLRPFRKYVILHTPMLRSPLSPSDCLDAFHPLECRFCVGGWIALGAAIMMGEMIYWLPLWGLSYFLTTQER